MTIRENEKYVNTRVNTIVNESLYNYKLNEDSGHPLFSIEHDKFSEFINKIENCIKTLNSKLSDSKVLNSISLKYKNLTYKGFLIEPIKIKLNDFYFDDKHDSENFTLCVNVVNVIKDLFLDDDYGNLKFITSGGFISIYNDVFKNSKIFSKSSEDRLIINCYAVNGKIIPLTFLHSFLHEYVHFSEFFNRVKNDKQYEKIVKTNYVNRSIRDVNNYYFEKNEHNALKNILYYLFAGNEINALIGNLFSDLLSLNITSLEEFNRNKNKLYSFEIYNILKNDINVIKNTNNKEFYKFIIKNYKLISKSDDTIDDTFLSARKKFINIAERQLNKFYTKQMKFVGNYISMINRCQYGIINAVIQY